MHGLQTPLLFFPLSTCLSADEAHIGICPLRRQFEIRSNFSSHPLMITSISQVVIGVGGVDSSISGSSSLKAISLSESIVMKFLLFV